MTRTSALALLARLALAPASGARAQSLSWSGDSPDGDPPVLVLDDSGARTLVGGVAAEAGPYDLSAGTVSTRAASR